MQMLEERCSNCGAPGLALERITVWRCVCTRCAFATRLTDKETAIDEWNAGIGISHRINWNRPERRTIRATIKENDGYEIE